VVVVKYSRTKFTVTAVVCSNFNATVHYLDISSTAIDNARESAPEPPYFLSTTTPKIPKSANFLICQKDINMNIDLKALHSKNAFLYIYKCIIIWSRKSIINIHYKLTGFLVGR